MANQEWKLIDTLRLELKEAKISLNNVNEEIKMLIGRNASEIQQSSKQKRRGHHLDAPKDRSRGRYYENYEPEAKKPNLDLSAGICESQHISNVSVTQKEFSSRQEFLRAQGADEKSNARNRRMFNALQGTLQKFKEEDTKHKSQKDKRAQVENKLEKLQMQEREVIKKKQRDLFYKREKIRSEIHIIELKLARVKQHNTWEDTKRPLMNFIPTRSKPHIYYLPKTLNDKNKELLSANRHHLERKINRNRKYVNNELKVIECRMKRKFPIKETETHHPLPIDNLRVELAVVQPEPKVEAEEGALLKKEDIALKNVPTIELKLKSEKETVVEKPQPKELPKEPEELVIDDWNLIELYD